MTAHLLSCTLAALLVVAVVLALHRQGASVRHALLVAAIFRVAVPTAWLEKAGAVMARHLHPAPLPCSAIPRTGRRRRPRNC
jgi:hypothetical protein